MKGVVFLSITRTWAHISCTFLGARSAAIKSFGAHHPAEDSFNDDGSPSERKNAGNRWKRAKNVTRKDETAGKAIVNGPQGYRERASRCEATEGQAGRDIRRRGAWRGERVMVSRRRRRGKFGESSGHATIRRTPFAPACTGTNRCHSPLTYPNPMQKTETSSNPPFPFRLTSPGAPYSSLLLSLLRTLSLSLHVFGSFLSVSRSHSFTLFLRYLLLITLPFLPCYITVRLHVAPRSYSCDIVGAARRDDATVVR